MPGESYSDARLDSTIAQLKPIFMQQFDVQGESDVEWLLFSFAPGRVNFIGEHVDYMGGWVCPAAVEEGTHILVGRVKHLLKDEKPRLRFYATLPNEKFEMDGFSGNTKGKAWTTFVQGAMTIRLKHLGVDFTSDKLRGVCMCLHGTLALGAGMSASAAFGIALIYAINSVVTGSYIDVPLTPKRRYAIMPKLPKNDIIEIIKQGRRIEIEFCGVNIGIMDQFASALSESNKFLFLDCTDLSYKTFSLEPLLGEEYCWMLIDSMIRHELIGGSAKVYNKVRGDQEDAEKRISQKRFNGAPFTFSQLVRNPTKYTPDGDALKFMRSCKEFLLPDEYDKGSYQVAEQLRTLEFTKLMDPALKMSRVERIKRAGAILNDAHKGMKVQMKITTPELDFVHDVANEHPGVAGGRMMGGGFGGCIIMIVKRSAVEDIIAKVQQKFKARFNVVNNSFVLEHTSCGAFTASLKSKVPSNL